MDWSTSSPLTSNFQTNNVQIQEQHQSQQFTAAGFQANASVQNSRTYSGNDQTTKILSNRMNPLANNLPFQNPGGSKTFHHILPKTSVHNDVQPAHLVLMLHHNSLGHASSENVQMAADMTQNSSFTKNVHISSPAVIQGSTENAVQNIPQKTVNLPIALDSYNNQPLQNRANSVTTSVYWQKRKSNICPNGLPTTTMHYYHVNGPATSQIDATVPFNQASSQYSNSQQNRSSLTAALHSQYYAPNTVSPIQYGVPAHHNSKNAAQTFPQDRNPPPYPVPPAQKNRGQFVLPQAVANISHENVQNYHSPVLDQNSNLYSAQLSERHQSVPFTRETSEVGNNPYSVSGYRTANQLPNELAKSPVEVGASLRNSVRVVGTVPSAVPLTPQTGRTLEQEKNLANGSRHFPDNLKDKITKERLALDGKKLHELKKAVSKLDMDFKMRCKMYLSQSSVRNGQAADTSVHNQNAATSLPSYNTNLNRSLPLPKDSNQAIQLLPHDTTQSLSPMSYSSGEVKYVPLSLKTNNHLAPILRHMLKGTTDENMLLNDHIEKGGSQHLAIKDNSSSAPMLSSSDVSETCVNNIDGASRLRSNITMDSTQVPLTCTKNGPVHDLPPIDQLVSWSKSAMEITGQYFTDYVQSSNQNSPASNGSSLSKKEDERECIEQSNTCLQKFERKTVAGSNEDICDTFNSASLPKATVQEAGTMQKSSVNGSPSVMTGVSWEVVKNSLALWTKNLPETLKHLRKNKDSTLSLSLSEVDGKTQQTLENLPSALTQKDQTKVTVGSNETTTSSVPSSLGTKLEVINSNLLKGSSELQVAIVTPLIMSKESIQPEVQEKTHSSLLEVKNPIIEENSVRSLQELNSLVPAAEEAEGGTLCSSSNTGITVKKEDIDMHEKTTKSSEENLIVKAEINKDCLINQVPQKDVKYYKSSDLQEPGDTVEVVLNDTVLEISSVCTLVQGDEFYNSQIACIFNSPLKSSKKNDTSEENLPYLHHSEQHSGLLKSDSEIIKSASEGDTFLPSQDCLSDATTEKLLDELSSLEIPQSGKASNEGNVIDSEEGKSMPQSTPLSGEKLEQNIPYDYIHSADFGSDNEVLPVNKGNLFSSTIADGTNATAKEDATKNALCEENQPDSRIDADDQLTELLKEFPYGISFPKPLENPENNNFVTKQSEKEDEEKPQSSVETPSQIQITILTSEQMKEMFPEQSQSSSNIQKNCDNDQFSTDFKDDLMEENKRDSQTDQAVPYDSRNTSAETTAAKPSKDKYCCLLGWLSSTMGVDPCKCRLPEKVSSKQKVDICPQSKTISKVRPETDAKTGLQENESKIDPEIVPLSSLEKLGSQELNIPVKQEMEELPLHTSSPTLKTETIEIKIQNHTHERENVSADKTQCHSSTMEMEELSLHTSSPTLKTETIEIKIQNHTRERDNVSADKTQCHSSTKDLKVVAARTLSKIETSVKQRPSKEKLVRSKTDHRRRIEIKRNPRHERYQIKWDSSETRIIKGPTLKRKMAIGKKHKTLVNQHNDAIKSPNINSIKIKNPQHKSTMLSPEHLNVRNKLDFEKNYGYTKNMGHMRINNEPSRTEHIEHNEESIQRKSLKLNLEKFAYSKENKNAGNYRSCYLDASPKHMNHASSILKIPFSVKEPVLDTHNRDKPLERSLSDKKTGFSRRTGRLSISLQKEQKKKYLNQVAFRRIAQKTICLTNLDSHSKPVWHVKSSSSALREDQKNSSVSSQQPEVEKPQMLEFKMCPEILFRKSVSEEQLLDGKNLPEKDKTPITAVKSKREDWLNYNPVKRRKTKEYEAQVNDDIPLDTAIKLLEGMPVKDSKTTFQTYKKMHLEKKSQSLDSTPLN
ncbi:retroelement silencing factor 1 isoform X1 [Zootoca vivipara]|uniref:retroelement silencing factor 1 isoform X1 n=1 Tax=Zootoca vivipara TaxID=8524 RepID=UPI00293BA11A|nr:retroelement silencing factor 1 isoform X1 [Zootoca vivipara]XP_034982476.2 retroelement silencing factor 1 isoform X1 [Zootoca vivipara]XP_034982477.2 retroelement silencing factor 1 isoform X1 [Zootoca vivipara]XP_034982478.2 retroelement silencing factor 1 isoform X1 [Zootoca vivipara]XP_060135938.1 retroelement silencing factor 1 isoform X1 [Zootoca vivipara]XP_060135939.1 retroelement silencing factor 1 isoform X1 [Zootoca vivipara]